MLGFALVSSISKTHSVTVLISELFHSRKKWPKDEKLNQNGLLQKMIHDFSFRKKPKMTLFTWLVDACVRKKKTQNQSARAGKAGKRV
jgi:hypothetical protein